MKVTPLNAVSSLKVSPFILTISNKQVNNLFPMYVVNCQVYFLNLCRKMRTFVGKKIRYAKKESWNVV